jgi:hypothetical protein
MTEYLEDSSQLEIIYANITTCMYAFTAQLNFQFFFYVHVTVHRDKVPYNKTN